MSEDRAPEASAALPMPHDPRIRVAVPQAARAKMAALWSLADRLTKLLDEVREPLIGQIKLAWWRDMMALLASNTDALPKGEPLLAELQQHWRGQAGLEALVDAAEALMLGENDADRTRAAADFGGQLFVLTSRSWHDPQGPLKAARQEAQREAGARWGLLWAAFIYRGGDEASVLLDAAAHAARPGVSLFGPRGKALVMLDRLAGQIAASGGARDDRCEGLILLRIGLFGR